MGPPAAGLAPHEAVYASTDPVAIDRFLIDVIDNKRKQEGAISVWERDMKYYSVTLADWERNPSINRFIREPGHIEYAGKLGLGVYDTAKMATGYALAVRG